ncbi:hypothetical protein GCM10009122_44860 [Fulvivirga kasyanovii]|uniref:Uncharacterized protein n=1 Tax=Fulvivirga kasyanovii TaxID=396812 RepID=A0ABW9RKD2_9BACT|nr:hypothetical protein [Fulvivirga kasyanovii]MTI24548.1 hypothetical protein [Fulvivirga kasyanovii]
MLTKTIFGFERARKAIKTKKGKPAYSKTNVDVRGDDNFRKDFIKIYNLKPEDFGEWDPKTKTFKMTFKNFDNSENATSKFLIKVAIESLRRSKALILQEYNMDQAKSFLLNKETKDWPFVMTDKVIAKEESIPTFTDKYELSKIDCRLKMFVWNGELFFRFVYSHLQAVINLCSRNTDWINVILKDDKFKEVYPEHLKTKFGLSTI